MKHVIKNRCKCLFEVVTLFLLVWPIAPVVQTDCIVPFKAARRIWKCVIRSWQRLRVAYFYQCLVSLSHQGPTSGSFASLVRESSSLAFSLRELEIELYTLTQPSGYAIRRNPRRVDICHDVTPKLLETLTTLCESTFSDANFPPYFIASWL